MGQASGPAARIPLSNRKGIPPKNRDGFVGGVDRLSLSWDGGPRTDDGWRSQKVLLDDHGTAGRVDWGRKVVVQGVEVFLGVSRFRGRGVFSKVEFNPSRIVDPEGVRLCSVGEVHPVVAEVLSSVRDLVDLPNDPDGCRVKRIDVARDFETDNGPKLLRALAPLPRPYAKRNMLHADPGRHLAQTLSVGSGVGMVRAYDKAAESQGKAPEGTLRWEVEARPGWADRISGIGKVADVTEERIAHLAADRFGWSGMGVDVSAGFSEVVERVVGAGLTAAVQRAFLGYLVEQAAGVYQELSFDAQSKYRKLQRELGIAVDPGVFEKGVGVSRRLDWESGREVLSVA